MKFDSLDSKMRVFEEAYDHCVLPGLYMVARLDGRGFTKWTKHMDFEKPFDRTFHDFMVYVTVSSMEHTGLNIIYGYTESDEISLLFHKNETSFNRKIRKLISILASSASAYGMDFWRLHHPNERCDPVVFDCRISQLPTKQDVVDYFRWRAEDSHRNCLNGYCYWKLREAGKTKRQATKILEGQGTDFKNELLFSEFGINYNEDVPLWQRRGTGVVWESFEREGRDPRTDEVVYTMRRALKENRSLPMKQEYGEYVLDILEKNE